MLESGAPLAARVPARLGWEIRLIVAGGLRVCERLRRAGFDPFNARPALGAADGFALAASALRLRLADARVGARPRPPARTRP
jgi:phytoene synthase